MLTHTDPNVVRSYGSDRLGMLRDHRNNAVAVGKPARRKIASINDARILDFRNALLTFYGIDSLPPGTEDQLRNLREATVAELADGNPPAGVEEPIAMKDRQRDEQTRSGATQRHPAPEGESNGKRASTTRPAERTPTCRAARNRT